MESSKKAAAIATVTLVSEVMRCHDPPDISICVPPPPKFPEKPLLFLC
jgi:hypothetical protein